MRIGTWNLAGRWTGSHADLLKQSDCDVWLLTEVRGDVTLDEYECHVTVGMMTSRRHWAGVFSRSPLVALPDPHPASAAAEVDGVTYVSSILPWRSCGAKPPWTGRKHYDRLTATLQELLPHLPSQDLVWGGDWNQALVGVEYAGSKAGRQELLRRLDDIDLMVPTAALSHQRPGSTSIDHIAVGNRASVVSVARCPAPTLSDHDLYIIELEGSPRSAPGLPR